MYVLDLLFILYHKVILLRLVLSELKHALLFHHSLAMRSRESQLVRARESCRLPIKLSSLQVDQKTTAVSKVSENHE